MPPKNPRCRSVTDISISADGSTIVLAKGDISALNRDGDVLWTYVTKADTRCVSVSSDAAHLIAGAVDGTVSQFKLQPGKSSVGQSAAPAPDVLPTEEALQTTTALPADRTPQTQEAAPAPAAPLAVSACLAMLAYRRRKGMA